MSREISVGHAITAMVYYAAFSTQSVLVKYIPTEGTMQESESRYWAYFDEAWKKLLERFFPQFLQFFVPTLYEAVDFQRPFTFLDKEMEQLSQQVQKGAKVVDKLVKVSLKDGSEEWILVHVEVQGDSDEDFSLRMFRYFYRIFDRYGQPIVSVAILTGAASRTADGRYERKAFGSGVEFHYLPFDLMGYERSELENSDNPMAIVVLASQERERHRQGGNRFDAKWYLIRRLYGSGYSREEIVALFEFIDWVIRLNEEEETRLWTEIQNLEEVKKMPYVTSVERIGIQKGLQQGLQQGLQGMQQMVLDVLEERFGGVPTSIADSIGQTQELDRLRLLHRHAIRAVSLEAFQQHLAIKKR